MKDLQTERLLLRQWTEADVEDVYQYAKSPNVGPNAGWKPHESREETLAIITRFIKEDETWAIVDKPSGRVIGSIGLHKDEKRNTKRVRALGYVLSQEYWGKGIMVEAAQRVMKYAFEEANLNLLSSYHFAFNVRSKRVLEKCGFKFEGAMRYAIAIYNGVECDEYCYSITCQEYENLN